MKSDGIIWILGRTPTWARREIAWNRLYKGISASGFVITGLRCSITSCAASGRSFGGTAEVALTFGRKRCDGGDGGGDGREGNVNGMADDGGSGMHRREREREGTESNVRRRRRQGSPRSPPRPYLYRWYHTSNPPSLFTSVFSPPTVDAPTLFGAGDHSIRTNDIQANS